jgi:hypothetical protein
LASILLGCAAPVQTESAAENPSSEHSASLAVVLRTATLTARCSAVAVGETTLLTAAHCLEGDGLPALAYVPHGSPTAHVGRTIRRDAARDLAWIETSTAMVPVGLGAAAVGELVTLERPLRGGAQMGLVRAQVNRQLLLDIPADHGDSGSPVFNGYGELVGLVLTCTRVTPDSTDCAPAGPSAAAALSMEDR